MKDLFTVIIGYTLGAIVVIFTGCFCALIITLFCVGVHKLMEVFP